MKTVTHITYPAFALFAFACVALSPTAQATCQEGCDLVDDNTFLGDDAFINNTTGSSNTAIGFNALYHNDIGNSNTAIGYGALYLNIGGYSNTASGFSALESNTTGSLNTANGYKALESNNSGFYNMASGGLALQTNTTGVSNTASGYKALQSNDSGSENTAIGVNALVLNTTGRTNIALGFNAGRNLTSGNRNIDIGNSGRAGESNTIRIGRAGDQSATYIAGIKGATVAGGVAVIVDAGGHLGTTTSSARYKEAIKPMDNASEAILALKPVTFRYKHDLDPEGIPQFDLVAEEVEKVNPDLVARDDQGKPYTVRYEAVNAMLLNEFLKEHRKVEKLEATVERLAATVKEQAAQIQKVSAQLETSKPAPQVVNNP